MNKNPIRPKKMNKIMSSIFNKKKDEPIGIMKSKKIIQELTEMGVFK